MSWKYAMTVVCILAALVGMAITYFGAKRSSFRQAVAGILIVSVSTTAAVLLES